VRVAQAISTFLFPKNRNERNRKSGVTLVELLIYMAASLAIVLMITFLYIFDIQQSFTTFEYANSSVSVQKTAFMITKYLHNAKEVGIYTTPPTYPSTDGNYIFLKGNSVYRVSVINTTPSSTFLIASKIASLTFWATPGKGHLVIGMNIIGTLQGEAKDSVSIKTEVALNNIPDMPSSSSTPGTVLFYIEQPPLK
jgi:hypothetical protein